MATVTLVTPAPAAASGAGPKGGGMTVNPVAPKWPRPHQEARGQLAVTCVSRTLSDPAVDSHATVERRAPHLLASAAIFALYFE